jgi:hypothetical protein
MKKKEIAEVFSKCQNATLTVIQLRKNSLKEEEPSG